MERVSSGGHSRALETLVPPERARKKKKTTVTIGVAAEKPFNGPSDYTVHTVLVS